MLSFAQRYQHSSDHRRWVGYVILVTGLGSPINYRYFPSWPTSAKTGISSPRHVRLGCRSRSGVGAWEPLA